MKEGKHFNSSDFKAWPSRYRANFFNSLGGFKSINLLATANAKGQLNLAPFFSVQHIGANPPLLSLIFRPETVERHSLSNFRNRGKASLNAVHSDIASRAHQTAAKYPEGVSEFEAVGLHPEKGDFEIPFVAEAHLSMGIEWVSEYKIQANNTLFVVASISEVHIRKPEAILEDGLIEHSLLDSLAVNGLDTYYQPKPYKRFAYAEVDKALKEKAWTKD